MYAAGLNYQKLSNNGGKAGTSSSGASSSGTSSSGASSSGASSSGISSSGASSSGALSSSPSPQVSPKVLKKPTKTDRFKRYSAKTGARLKARAKKLVREAPGEAIRLSGRAIGAGIGATVGLAGGIAQGDLGQAATNVAGGLVLGSALGSGATNGMANWVDDKMADKIRAEDPEQAVNRVENSKKYREIAQYDEMEKQKRQDKDDLKAMLGADVAKKVLEKGGGYEQLYSNGITDVKDIATIATMVEGDEKGNTPISSYKEGIALYKQQKEIGDEYKGPKAKDRKEDLRDRYMKKANLSDAQASKAAEDSLSLIGTYNKIKKDL